MGTKTDEKDSTSKEAVNPLSPSTQKEDRKPVPNAVKYITAALIFFGNVTFVSYHIKKLWDFHF